MATVREIAHLAGAMTSSGLSRRILTAFVLVCTYAWLLPILAGGVSAAASDSEGSTVFDDRRLTNPSGIACFAGKLYVANSGADSVTIYSARANGKIAAIDGIRGLNTRINAPKAIALDSAGKIYLANQGLGQDGGGSIAVYAAHSSGSVGPIAVIEGNKTRLNSRAGLAVDSSGNIFVANAGPADGRGVVTVYAPGSSDNAEPVNLLEGPSTQLDKPAGVAVDSAGYIYVSNFHTDPGFVTQLSVKIYRPGSRGDAAPIASVNGNASMLDSSGAIALGPKGDVFVGDLSQEIETNSSIGVVYRDPRYLNVGNDTFALRSSISGSRTGLSELSGIAVDPAGRIYAANSQANSIAIFAAGATGDVAPIAKIENPTKTPPLPSDAPLRKLPWTQGNMKSLRALTKAAVLRFSEEQQGAELDEIDPSVYATFEFGWYPAGGGNYELAVDSQSGPDIGWVNIFWKSASGKVTSQDFGEVAYGGTEEWYHGPQFADLDHDGKTEFIDFGAIENSCRGLDRGKFIPEPSWPQVYRLRNGRYVEASRDFASVYEKEILPQLDEAIVEARRRIREVAAEKAKPASATTPQTPAPYDSYWFRPARYLAAITMCRDKILRVIGRDPNAGLKQAREWMKSSDPVIIDDARIVFEDIDNARIVFRDMGGHQKEADDAGAATKIAIERWPDKETRWLWCSHRREHPAH